MILPPFDISGGWPLALARGVSVAGLLSTFGALLARVAFVPPTPLPAGSRRLLQLSLAASWLGAAAWAWQVSASLADAPDMASVSATLPIVLLHTWFGHVLLARLALLAVAALCAARLPKVAALVAGLAVLTQSGHSHALSMQPGLSLLLVGDGLHLLAAGAWLGGLLPLLLLIRGAPPRIATRACRRFSYLGGACVVLLAGTAVLQSWTLVGSLPALLGTAYGIVASAKIGLLLLLLALAATNRFRHTPALAADRPGAARRLIRSIGIETACGLLVVLAAGLLTSLPPSMHTPVLWPFAQRPSLAAVDEDPDFRREVVAAILALAGAACLLVLAALLRRRRRWLALAAAAAIVWFTAPHLDLLLVDAYPTSYQHSPTGFAARSILQGAALYPANCAGCHGAQGRGDGPQAAASPVPPADLTAAHLWMHSDGELIWWLSHGMDAPAGGLAMPGFAGTLSLPDRWALIDFIRARNAGLVRRTTGTWAPPLPAPGWQAVCADGGTVSLAGLRGRVARLILGSASAYRPAQENAAVVTILADPAAAQAPAGACLAADPAIRPAYALVAGLIPAEAAGGQFLIDDQGWLRAFQPPGTAPGWDDRQVLRQALDAVRAHRLTAGSQLPMSQTMPMNMPM